MGIRVTGAAATSYLTSLKERTDAVSRPCAGQARGRLLPDAEAASPLMRAGPGHACAAPSWRYPCGPRSIVEDTRRTRGALRGRPAKRTHALESGYRLVVEGEALAILKR